jgi:Fic family protein
MNEADFRKPSSPGRLEATTFLERPRVPTSRAREVVGFGYVPHDLPAGLTRKDVIVGTHDWLMEAERGLSHLQGVATRIRNPGVLIGPFARKEARHSSAIENTFASDEQLALFDIDKSAVEPVHRPDVQEVRNYLTALQQGFDDPRPICLNLIKEMHATLLVGSTRVAGRPGEFRTTQNAIGDQSAPFKDARFVPPPPRFVAECLHKLESYLHARDDMPELVRLALVHYQFECIHPFDDGNGRLGRLLIALQLCKQGRLSLPLVYVSGALEKERQRYYDLLYRVSTEGAWLDWINFFLSAIAVQATDAARRATRLDELRSEYYRKVQKKRASAMLPKLVDELFSSPASTVARAAEIAGMRVPSAGKLISQLEDAGILREATGRRHFRVFVAPEILAMMNEDLDPPQETTIEREARDE